MKKLFKRISDVNNNQHKIPLSSDAVIFFHTRDDHFFIYSLYTKRNLTEPDFFEVSKTDYINEVETYKDIYKTDPIIIITNDELSARGLMAYCSYKAEIDTTTVGESLKLN